jgi:hypothetical protein
MPFNVADRRRAVSLAREVRKFANLVTKISRDSKAPTHPEIKAGLEAFRRINKLLASGTGPDVVTLRNKVRIGQEFEKIGGAIRGRRKR